MFYLHIIQALSRIKGKYLRLISTQRFFFYLLEMSCRKLQQLCIFNEFHNNIHTRISSKIFNLLYMNKLHLN